jgi:hypothetical protein
MAGSDDDLERLMREVDASLSGGPASSSPANLPAKKSDGSPSEKKTDSASESRLSRATGAGLVAGATTGVIVFVVVFLFQWLPLVGHPFAAALGAFIAAFITATYLTFKNDKD